LPSITRFLRKNIKNILLTFLLFVFQAVVYLLTNQLTTTYHDVHTRLDDLIPFCPVFIVFYKIWYPYVPVLLLFGMHKDSSLFRRQLLTLFTGVFLCLFIYTVYPTAISFRPVVEGNDFFSRLCRNLYAFDNSTDALPSMHCHNALSIHLTTFYASPLGKYRVARYTSLGLCILICASTVLIKQHSILDVIAGCLLAIILFFIFKMPIFRRFYDKAV